MTVTWHTPRTWAAGEKPTASQFNQYMRDNIQFLGALPDVSPITSFVRQYTSTQTVNSYSGWNKVEFDVSIVDTYYDETGTYAFDVSSTHEFTAPVAGFYMAMLNVAFTSSLGDGRAVGAAIVRTNGSNGNETVMAVRWTESPGEGSPSSSVEHIDYLDVGDGFYGVVNHDGTSNQDLQNTSGQTSSHMFIYRLSVGKDDAYYDGPSKVAD